MTPYELAASLYREISPVAPKLAAALNRALLEIGEGSVLVGLSPGMGAGDDVTFSEREILKVDREEAIGVLARITQALQLLEEHAVSPQVIEYLKTPPDAATLEQLLEPESRDALRQILTFHVVPGAIGHGPILSPARHASEHQAWIDFETDFGADAEPLCDARSEPFDERVRGSDELQQRLPVCGVFQVQGDALLAAAHHVEVGLQERGLRPADSNDLRAEVGKQHASKRARPDAFDFDDSNSVEWTHDLKLR